MTLRPSRVSRVAAVLPAGCYESKCARGDFGQHMHGTRVPVGARSVEVRGDLPSKRAESAWVDRA